MHKKLVYLLLIGAFGPYLFPSLGIRLDQFLVYIVFLYLLFSGELKLPKDSTTLAIFFLLFVIFLFPFINSINPINVISNSLLIAQIENYIQPIVLFITFYSLLPSKQDEIERIFKNGLELILWMLVFNTMLSMYIFLNPETSVIKLFGGSKILESLNPIAAELTLAELNLTTGKFSGVFNQTFLVGFIYSLGLLIWGYLYKNKKEHNLKKIFFMIIILLGGIMSFSKVFIVIGIPMFLIFLGIKRSLVLFISLFFLLIAFLIYDNSILEIINDYKAIPYFTRLIVGITSGNILDTFTSSRLDLSSPIFQDIVSILSTNPLFGLGYGSIETSDLSFYEIVSLGGFMGLLAYLLLMLVLLAPIYNLLTLRDKYFYALFIFLTFIASLGGPIFTANRVSIIIWFIILLTHQRIKKLSTI